jgi:hypothetical protein
MFINGTLLRPRTELKFCISDIKLLGKVTGCASVVETIDKANVYTQENKESKTIFVFGVDEESEISGATKKL